MDIQLGSYTDKVKFASLDPGDHFLFEGRDHMKVARYGETEGNAVCLERATTMHFDYQDSVEVWSDTNPDPPSHKFCNLSIGAAFTFVDGHEICIKTDSVSHSGSDSGRPTYNFVYLDIGSHGNAAPDEPVKPIFGTFTLGDTDE